MPDNMNSRIDFLTVLSMRAEELRRLIFIEQLNNPMLEMTDYSFASFIHDRDPDEVRNELLAKGIEDPLLEAIVRIFFREILEGRISTISRSLQVTTNRVREAAAKIMDMIPYEPSEGGEIPDLEAEPEGDEWSIRVFPDEGILRLNEHYIQMVEELGEANTIEGFSNRIQRAKQLFASVQQRTDVLKEMMRRLLGAQRLFALHGGEPKEIPRRSLSDVLGVYPTVLYLASAGKYVRVPAGVIPMDRFFGPESELEAEREREAGEANNAVSVLSETGLLRASAEAENNIFRDPDEVESVAEICMLAPSKEMAMRTAEVCRVYGKKVDVFASQLDEAANIAAKLEAKGAQVFISRQGTKKRIQERTKLPVVDVYMDLADYVEILENAARVKGMVAFFTYGIVQEDVRSMSQLMGLKARFYSFYNMEDCTRIVKQAIREGAELGIGGATSADVSALYGLEHVTVENSPMSLLKAIEAAEQILKLRKEEAAKQADLALRLERFNLALNFTHDAVLAVDRTGKIEVMNHAAEKLVGVGMEEAVGKRIDQVIPDTRVLPVLESGRRRLNNVLRHGNSIWSSNIVPIMIEGTVRGAVTTFQDVRSLQNDEKRIRIKLAEKGLVAKYHFDDIWGRTSEIRNAVRAAEKFARADATVLIHGETGTGKELFAQSIHNASSRADGPFVAVNCGSLPRDILEAELFGYVEGAFTGASRGGKTGLFEMAHEGTIFLDEIGEMPLETQVQLLRVLQEKEIRRLGSDRVTPVDIRVIAATNRDLPKEIAAGRFRQDLYYRLNVLNIAIPPLRERRSDVSLILLKFLGAYMPTGPEEEALVNEVLKDRTQYRWPGNVREVANIAERIYVLLSQGEDAGFILEMLRAELAEADRAEEAPDVSLPGTADGRENRDDVGAAQADAMPFRGTVGPREALLRALRENGYEMGRTAEALGVNRSTLWRRMKKYGIRKDSMWED